MAGSSPKLGSLLVAATGPVRSNCKAARAIIPMAGPPRKLRGLSPTCMCLHNVAGVRYSELPVAATGPSRTTCKAAREIIPMAGSIPKLGCLGLTWLWLHKPAGVRSLELPVAATGPVRSTCTAARAIFPMAGFECFSIAGGNLMDALASPC